MDFPLGKPIRRAPEKPPMVLSKFRREEIVPALHETLKPANAHLVDSSEEPVARATADSFEIVRDGALEEGQRALRDARAREAAIRGYPGVKEVTLQDLAEFCIKESGIAPTLIVADTLSRAAQVSMVRLPKFASDEDDFSIDISARITRSGLLEILDGRVYCTPLAHYSRLPVPAEGLRRAYAVRDLADNLVVVDLAHAHWMYTARQLTAGPTADPMLLAVVLRPYAGSVGYRATDATLFSLCTWK
ncbi:MAG: hypothetical protein ABSE73_16525 [Planctomycetota bacterium]